MVKIVLKIIFFAQVSSNYYLFFLKHCFCSQNFDFDLGLKSLQYHGTFQQNVDLFFQQDKPFHELKKNFLKKIFGYLARCDFLGKIRVAILNLVGYVEILAKFGAKSDFRV